MRALISSYDNLEGYHHNDNDDGDDPLSPQLRAQFETLCAMQRQQIKCHDDDDGEGDAFLGIDDTGDDDDEYYEAMFSLSSSCATAQMITDEGTNTMTAPCHNINGHKQRRIMESSLALSTSILAQREIEEVRNGIAELEDFLRCADWKVNEDHSDDELPPFPTEEEETDDGGGGRMHNPCTVDHNEIKMPNSLGGRGRDNTTIVRSDEAVVAATETTTSSPR